MKKLVALFLLCWAAQVQAVEVAGVKLADSVHPGSRDLELNGAGVRTKIFFDLYVAALYLGEKKSNGAAVLADGGEKRMALYLLRDISADRLLGAFNAVIAANHTPAEMAALDALLREFSAIFHTMGEVKKGDVITLDYQPASGTQVSVNGVSKGMIAGAAFNTALLKIWLGDKPAQADLKQKLLGGQ
ncbi:MAG: chalcone isomerase family protein [Betaproteobacteria bacterium]|nr:chalcone isomerase family protein [Betaproteobacteria bacterium]